MSFTLVDAVNSVLRDLGEPPVSSIDEQYPTLDIILPEFENRRVAVLSELWWFNTFEDYTVNVDVNGESPTPVNTLEFYPDRPDYIWDGRVVRTLQNTNPGQALTGRLVTDIAFDDLPRAAQDTITAYVARDTYTRDVGVDSVLESILARLSEAAGRLSKQHTRQMQVTSMRRKPLQRWRNALQRRWP